MLDTLLRALVDLGPSVIWVAKFCAAVVAVFVLYVGIAIWAAIRARDLSSQVIRYQIFRDLLDLFRRGRNR
jgi:hypothetical protein